MIETMDSSELGSSNHGNSGPSSETPSGNSGPRKPQRLRLSKSLAFYIAKSTRKLSSVVSKDGYGGDDTTSRCSEGPSSSNYMEDETTIVETLSSLSSVRSRSKSPSGRRRMLIRLPGSLNLPKTVVASPDSRSDKRVTFSCEAPMEIDPAGEHDEEETLDKPDLFYSRRELAHMMREAQALGEEVAWKGDRLMVPCVQCCYGFSNYRGDLTVSKALQHFYYYKLREDTMDPKTGATVATTTTTLRGLERQVASQILEYRMECIQSVLELQARLQDEMQTNRTNPTIEAALKKRSAALTQKARRFARLLGKADAAIVCRKAASSDDASTD